MRLPFIAILVFFTFFSWSQKEMSTKLRFLSEQSNISNLKLNVLVEGAIDQLVAEQAQFKHKVIYTSGNLASIECDYNTLLLLIEKGLINYSELAHSKYKPLNDTMVLRNRIKQVKLWTAPLPQAYNGEGILIGIIDTGVDFNHPDFQDSLGHTRILYLWDQTVSSGVNAPTPFGYGREWTSTEINNHQCTHSDAPYYGHGTHVAGIAAGNGRANGKNEGVASKSDLIVVALDFNRVGTIIADAVSYVFKKAQQIGKPCVVNASVGDYYGSHDGTDLESKMIDNLLINKPGRVLVAASGNAGGVKYHTKTQSQAGDTVFTWMKNNSSILEYWCYGDTNQLKNLKISIGVNRNSFTDLGRTTFRNYKAGLTSIKKDTIYFNTKRIGSIQMASSVNSSGVCEWYYQIKADSVNTYWRIETTGAGLQHAWNFDFVSTGLPNATQYPKITKYMMPDTFYTMVSGFQNSEEVLTVGNYVNLYQYKDVNNQTQTLNETGGKIAQSSSSGPTRDNRIKPDVTATGNSVFSAIVVSLKASFIANEPNKVALGGWHILGGGTSAASPVVAGLAALYLQKHPTATNREVRDAVRYCAYHDGHTGNALPNYQWGFGKLDGKAAMTCSDIQVFTGIDLQEKNQIQCFPNPTNNKVNIHLQNNDGGQYAIYNLNGQLLHETSFEKNTIEVDLNQICTAYKGLLLFKIINAQKAFTLKVIKE